MSAAAVVIALFVNGVQIVLPAPAFVEGGTSWVPARVVLERMGCKITLDGATGRLDVISPAGERHSMIPMRARPAPQIEAAFLYMYRNNAGISYIPAKALRSLSGCLATWDHTKRRLDLWVAPSSQANASATSVGDLLNRGPESIGETVTAEGEYLGRPVSPPDSKPPLSAADDDMPWLLRGAGGTLLCANAPQLSPPFPMTAYGSRGRRLRVTGTVAADVRHGVRLLVTEAVPAAGPAGATCLLESAQPAGHDTLLLHALLKDASLALVGRTQPMPTVRATTYSSHQVTKLDIKSTSWTALASHDGAWHTLLACDIAGLAPGTYGISVEVPPGVTSFEVMMRLGD